jgi:hypothetical protein
MLKAEGQMELAVLRKHGARRGIVLQPLPAGWRLVELPTELLRA